MEKVRDIRFDYIRVLAIVSVVFCHSVESYYYIYTNRLKLWNSISIPSRIFDLVGISFGRIGVPLFSFLTGILM